MVGHPLTGSTQIYLEFPVWKVGHHYDNMVLVSDAEFYPHYIVTSTEIKFFFIN